MTKEERQAALDSYYAGQDETDFFASKGVPCRGLKVMAIGGQRYVIRSGDSLSTEVYESLQAVGMQVVDTWRAMETLWDLSQIAYYALVEEVRGG